MVDVLRAAAVVNADVEAYVEPARRRLAPRQHMTFAQWDRAADGVAGLLARHGVTRGSVVCLLLPSSIDYMVCYAAATRLGAVTSGDQPPPRRRRGRARSSSGPVRRSPWSRTERGPGGADRGRSSTGRPSAAAMGGPPPRRWPELSPSDPVAVVWTSGTTGLPKGAVFDHASLAAVADGHATCSPSPVTAACPRCPSPTWDP